MATAADTLPPVPPDEPDRDLDPRETEEWLEALDDVMRRAGPERAAQLLGRLVQEARLEGAPVPVSDQTPYVNTIHPEDEAPIPGDPEVERRLRSAIRWNAAAMVLQANKESSELGGHIASFQSAATLYEVDVYKRQGVGVSEFALGSPSLDEVFLALTGHPAEEIDEEEAA